MSGLKQDADDPPRSIGLRRRASAVPISFRISFSRILAVLPTLLLAVVAGCETQKSSDRDARIVNPVGSTAASVEPISTAQHGEPQITADHANTGNTDAKKAVDVIESAVAPQAEFQSALTEKIRLKNSAGETQLSIKPEPDGAKLVDADESELARYNLRGDKLKIKSADDTVLGYVTGGHGHYFIKDAAEKIVRYELQRQPDGDWKLKDGKEQLICSIRKREYGFEIEDVADRSLFKCKLKDGKLSLRDASDQTTSQTRDPLPMAAMVCLGLESIESLPLRVGLVVRLAIEGAD
jgi:hypothetical protein